MLLLLDPSDPAFQSLQSDLMDRLVGMIESFNLTPPVKERVEALIASVSDPDISACECVEEAKQFVYDGKMDAVSDIPLMMSIREESISTSLSQSIKVLFFFVLVMLCE